MADEHLPDPADATAAAARLRAAAAEYRPDRARMLARVAAGTAAVPRRTLRGRFRGAPAWAVLVGAAAGLAAVFAADALAAGRAADGEPLRGVAAPSRSVAPPGAPGHGGASGRTCAPDAAGAADAAGAVQAPGAPGASGRAACPVYGLCGNASSTRGGHAGASATRPPVRQRAVRAEEARRAGGRLVRTAPGPEAEPHRGGGRAPVGWDRRPAGEPPEARSAAYGAAGLDREGASRIRGDFQ